MIKPIDAVRAISQAPGNQQDDLINDFLRDHWPLFVRTARQYCRTTGRPAASHLDDFTSLVAEEALLMIREAIEDESTLDATRIWEALLKSRCRNRIRNWIRASDQPASGMSGKLRLSSQLHALKWTMTGDLGREPSDEEVVTENNRVMTATRKNPQKEAVLASVDDMKTEKYTADIDLHGDIEVADYDCVISPLEGRAFLRSVTRAAWNHSEKMGAASAIWLEHVYENEESKDTTKAIASKLGIRQSEVPDVIAQIRALAEQVLMDSLGISGADV